MAIGDSWRVVRDSKGGAATEEAATSSAVLVGAEYSIGTGWGMLVRNGIGDIGGIGLEKTTLESAQRVDALVIP